MIKNMVRTSEPKNQEFHKHNEPQSKIRCSYKKNVYIGQSMFVIPLWHRNEMTCKNRMKFSV